AAVAIVNRRVKTVPTSTTNITGFFHWMSGRSMTKACLSAALSRSGANRPRRRLWRRASLASWESKRIGGEVGFSKVTIFLAHGQLALTTAGHLLNGIGA